MSQTHFTSTLTLLVENEFGALTRITSLIRRRGYNISSLVVAETIDPMISRITLTLSSCEESRLTQIVEQIRKCINVIRVEIYHEKTFMSRELLMIRLLAKGNRYAIAKIADNFHAHLIEATDRSITLELADTPEKTHAFVEALEPYGVIDLARTGIVALERCLPDKPTDDVDFINEGI